MTAGKHAPSTYDQMMAEIEMDSDDDDVKTHNTKLPPKADAKSSETERWHVKSGKPSNLSKSSKASEEKSRDDLDVVLQPPALRKHLSRREGRSLDDMKDDSADDSDEEKETHIRQQDHNTFASEVQKSQPQNDPVLGFHHDINDLRVFVSRAPSLGSSMVRCVIERDRHGMNRFNPIYRLFLEDGNYFLLSAQKRSSSKTSNYLLSLDKTAINRRSPLIVGKLRANWSGSEYTIFDSGLSPAKTAIDASVRTILGFVEFAYDEMGPGRLNIRIPKVHENGIESTKWKDRDVERDEAARKEFESTLDASALALRNKRPQYDAQSRGHILDFHGRINMPSIKNFQIQSDAHGDDTVLQFGRVSCQPPGPHRQCKCHKDTFKMDVGHPLSPIQAFSICLATLDAKVADVKAYESVTHFMRRLSS